jgi:hypothetical protein
MNIMNVGRQRVADRLSDHLDPIPGRDCPGDNLDHGIITLPNINRAASLFPRVMPGHLLPSMSLRRFDSQVEILSPEVQFFPLFIMSLQTIKVLFPLRHAPSPKAWLTSFALAFQFLSASINLAAILGFYPAF